MNSAVLMVDAFSNPGSAIMKMTVKTVLTKKIVSIHLVWTENLLVLTIVAFPCLKFVTE